MFDLHCHTTASDGLLTPEELVERAVLSRVAGIAVTDHDTVDAVPAAQAAVAERDLRVIGGIELSTRWNDRNVHVLGYFIDPDNAELRQETLRIRDDRLTRGNRMVGRLQELGYDVSMEDVRAQAARAQVIARPHIARALVAKGYIPSVRDAFTADLIADGGRADVAKVAVTPMEAVRLIRGSGGAAVLAHPGVGHHDGPLGSIPYELIDELAAAGLAGLEVEHPDHPPLVRDKLRLLADELDLVLTGGSDFHGEAGHVLGTCATTPENLARLEELAGAT
jgi:predicted metal-dependent phosphoesterase TrpH